MLEDSVLERIFADKEIKNIPIEYVSTMIKVVEKAIEEEENVTQF